MYELDLMNIENLELSGRKGHVQMLARQMHRYAKKQFKMDPRF